MSRLENAYKYEVKEVRKLGKRFRRLPVKGFIGMVLSLASCVVVLLALVALSISGTVSVEKKDMGINAGATIHVSLPTENVTRVVDIVLPSDSHPPKVTESSTTTSTTTTLKNPIIYGHVRMPDGLVDPVTGVGSRATGETRCGT